MEKYWIECTNANFFYRESDKISYFATDYILLAALMTNGIAPHYLYYLYCLCVL